MWTFVARRQSVVAFAVCAVGLAFTVQPVGLTAAETDAVLAVVNGRPLRQSDLDLHCLVRRIPEAERANQRERLIEKLIDQRLLAEFLTARRTEAAPEELDARIAGVRAAIARGGKDPDAELQRLGISADVLRQALALPLAWQQHVRRVVTADQLAEHWAAHHVRYDGTRRRVSQIVLTLPADADDAARQAAVDRLTALQAELAAGRLTFADAARTHSQSPSREQGGDVGWMVYGTNLPRELADVAFSLPLQAVSPPTRSRFGVHLLTVTAEEPGDLSLEDVRGEVLTDLGRRLWDEQLATERANAKITRSGASAGPR